MKPQTLHKPKRHLNAVPSKQSDAPLQFEEVFDRFSPYVASVLLRLLGNNTAVDDLVQDVFLDCFEKFDSIHSWEHARNWLVKVAVRKAGRKLRRQKLVRWLRLSDAGFQEPAVPSVSADERAELAMLYKLLEKLPIKTRLAWTLRYFEGAQISEIAFACGCSPATAKRRIRAAQQFIIGEKP